MRTSSEFRAPCRMKRLSISLLLRNFRRDTQVQRLVVCPGDGMSGHGTFKIGINHHHDHHHYYARDPAHLFHLQRWRQHEESKLEGYLFVGKTVPHPPVGPVPFLTKNTPAHPRPVRVDAARSSQEAFRGAAARPAAYLPGTISGPSSSSLGVSSGGADSHVRLSSPETRVRDPPEAEREAGEVRYLLRQIDQHNNPTRERCMTSLTPGRAACWAWTWDSSWRRRRTTAS